MNALPETVAATLWTMSWQSAPLAAAVALVCRLGRRRIPAAVRSALWGLVLARLALPVLPPSPTSVYTLLPVGRAPSRDRPASLPQPSISPSPRTTPAGPSAAATSVVAQAFARTAADEPDALKGEAVPVPRLRTAVDRVPESPSAGRPPIAGDRARTAWVFLLRTALLCGWLAGAILLLTRLVVQTARLRRVAARWRTTDDPDLQGLFDRCRREAGVNRACLRIDHGERRIGPAMHGILRPTVVLDASDAVTLPTAELRLVLRHELEHVRRRDALWDRLATVLTAVHWFNPVAWWASAALRDLREQACDAAVLDGHDRSAGAGYGELVLRLAQRCRGPETTAMVGVFGRSANLRRRIEMITDRSPDRRVPRWPGLLADLVLALGGLTAARSAQPRTEPPQPVAAQRPGRPDRGPTAGQAGHHRQARHARRRHARRRHGGRHALEHRPDRGLRDRRRDRRAARRRAADAEGRLGGPAADHPQRRRRPLRVHLATAAAAPGAAGETDQAGRGLRDQGRLQPQRRGTDGPGRRRPRRPDRLPGADGGGRDADRPGHRRDGPSARRRDGDAGRPLVFLRRRRPQRGHRHRRPLRTARRPRRPHPRQADARPRRQAGGRRRRHGDLLPSAARDAAPALLPGAGRTGRDAAGRGGDRRRRRRSAGRTAAGGSEGVRRIGRTGRRPPRDRHRRRRPLPPGRPGRRRLHAVDRPPAGGRDGRERRRGPGGAVGRPRPPAGRRGRDRGTGRGRRHGPPGVAGQHGRPADGAGLRSRSAETGLRAAVHGRVRRGRLLQRRGGAGTQLPEDPAGQGLAPRRVPPALRGRRGSRRRRRRDAAAAVAGQLLPRPRGSAGGAPAVAGVRRA